jgi:hypothetical protein
VRRELDDMAVCDFRGSTWVSLRKDEGLEGQQSMSCFVERRDDVMIFDVLYDHDWWWDGDRSGLGINSVAGWLDTRWNGMILSVKLIMSRLYESLE